ncbi:Mitogen-activated protein kinase [Hondaea fermentalgiana]|uniref:Mitogen-activated protein kinase n=1 Tax=Hondaea fermentalgiana TaxID=2315210 RepID=A0A2R5H0Z4_9STRA|nr:Mitogen-activated protein kinase [Hondaea fermentalgiana]|eukprot:GBG33994.1 Mitogen-activated protein kinase [Hondaea fermentalgiana]
MSYSNLDSSSDSDLESSPDEGTLRLVTVVSVANFARFVSSHVSGTASDPSIRNLFPLQSKNVMLPTPLDYGPTIVGNEFTIIHRTSTMGLDSYVKTMLWNESGRAGDHSNDQAIKTFDNELECYSVLHSIQGNAVPVLIAGGDDGFGGRFIITSSEGIQLDKYLAQTHCGNVFSKEKLRASARRALKLIHSHGILHQDMAPRNIVVNENASDPMLAIKFIDFGNAKKCTNVQEFEQETAFVIDKIFS